MACTRASTGSHALWRKRNDTKTFTHTCTHACTAAWCIVCGCLSVCLSVWLSGWMSEVTDVFVGVREEGRVVEWAGRASLIRISRVAATYSPPHTYTHTHTLLLLLYICIHSCVRAESHHTLFSLHPSMCVSICPPAWLPGFLLFHLPSPSLSSFIPTCWCGVYCLSACAPVCPPRVSKASLAIKQGG